MATLITESEAEQMFDEYLDDSTEQVNIGYGTFYASEILKRCDPIAYRLGVADFIDHLAANAGIYTYGITESEMPEEDEEE